MTSDGILLTREPLMLDRKEEMLAGWRLRSKFGSLGCQYWGCHLVASWVSQ